MIVLLSQTLNWMFHFGDAARFSRDVKWIQIATHPEDIHANQRAAVALVGTLRPVLKQLIEHLKAHPVKVTQ